MHICNDLAFLTNYKQTSMCREETREPLLGGQRIKSKLALDPIYTSIDIYYYDKMVHTTMPHRNTYTPTHIDFTVYRDMHGQKITIIFQ